MKEEISEEGSLLNRKRPAVEGLIEDILGPRSQLDEMISTKPWLNLNTFNEDTEENHVDDSHQNQ